MHVRPFTWRTRGNTINVIEKLQHAHLLRLINHIDNPQPMLAGREVLRMYGRLRGVPARHLEAMVDRLLQRLGLGQYADRVCDSYSGGNKRKLSVAVALVGDPPAVLMDEPSTGMDPGAKRFLWDLIQKQVVDAGQSVLWFLLCSA